MAKYAIEMGVLCDERVYSQVFITIPTEYLHAC